jgi:hypothetical protein
MNRNKHVIVMRRRLRVGACIRRRAWIPGRPSRIRIARAIRQQQHHLARVRPRRCQVHRRTHPSPQRRRPTAGHRSQRRLKRVRKPGGTHQGQPKVRRRRTSKGHHSQTMVPVRCQQLAEELHSLPHCRQAVRRRHPAHRWPGSTPRPIHRHHDVRRLRAAPALGHVIDLPVQHPEQGIERRLVRADDVRPLTPVIKRQVPDAMMHLRVDRPVHRKPQGVQGRMGRQRAFGRHPVLGSQRFRIHRRGRHRGPRHLRVELHMTQRNRARRPIGIEPIQTALHPPGTQPAQQQMMEPDERRAHVRILIQMFRVVVHVDMADPEPTRRRRRPPRRVRPTVHPPILESEVRCMVRRRHRQELPDLVLHRGRPHLSKCQTEYHPSPPQHPPTRTVFHTHPYEPHPRFVTPPSHPSPHFFVPFRSFRPPPPFPNPLSLLAAPRPPNPRPVYPPNTPATQAPFFVLFRSFRPPPPFPTLFHSLRPTLTPGPSPETAGTAPSPP